ncbi:MoaD/ThiS family protein [soil metagenome]
MSVTVRLPGALGEATGGATKFEAAGASLGEVVADRERRYPALRGRILDESGALPVHVNVFIDAVDARHAGGARAAVPDGAVVMVIPAMAGGALHVLSDRQSFV